jgi:hypothetical protein
VSITKVVVLLTRNRTKLSLHFSDFSTICRDFTRISKVLSLLKMYFCAGAPRTFQSLTNVPLYCTKLPEKTWGLAMPPLAMGAARLRPIPASRRHSRHVKRSGSTRSSPRAQGWPRFERRGRRRGRAAAAAAALGDGEEGAWLGNARPWEVQWVL